MNQNAQMGMHVGHALSYITDNYPTINKVILELIQNSLDSDANLITVYVDYHSRTIYVRDNGNGISPEKFQHAISRVCSSLKQKDKLGQFGIGMLSPLGKCRNFTITSSPAGGNSNYNQWLFDGQSILENSEFSEIPRKAMPELLFSNTGKFTPNRRSVQWRTEVALHSFSKDSTINAVGLEDLRTVILGQFSQPMKRLDTTISLRIRRSKDHDAETLNFKAAQFKGEKLDVIVYGDSKVGQTTFEIYISPKTKSGRKGEILFGLKGNDFRIPMSTFKKSIVGIANQETINILASGTFEGCILSDNCLLHQSRREFREDESLMEFCLHLDAWAENYGQKHIISMKDGERDVRLQAIGQVAIKNLEEKLRTEMPHLMALVKNFKIGTIGSGHNGFDFAAKNQGFKAKEAKTIKDNEASASPSSSAKRQDNDHPGHTPFSVSGPRGAQRRLVRGHSTGVQFVFEELPGNDHHWEFDEQVGILTFNMRSDLWAKVESHDRNLILYQEYVAVKALEMCLEPTPTRQTIFEFLQRELRTAVILIMSSSALQPRKAKAEVGRRLNS